MLTIAKNHINSGERWNSGLYREPINVEADIHLFGQEVNPETFAVCKSDLFMKSADGRDAENIAFGSVLSNDRHAGISFDYLIANPPYGKDWKRDQAAVKAEHERGMSGRFGPGLPRISDGQLLFLLHMISHMKAPEEGGSRIAIIMNGSPLFTGDAGSGESEIRRWILEDDLLEALIALPEQLFYNTGIATYVWVLTNRKAPERKGAVQLIDATASWAAMRRSLGDKRREIKPEHAGEIIEMLLDLKDDDRVRVFPGTRFGFRKITVERPLRLNFRATPERIARLDDQRAFQNMARSKKKDPAKRKAEEAEGQKQQQEIKEMLATIPDRLFTDRAEFEDALKDVMKGSGIKITAPVRKAILAALSERDENAEICLDKDGNPEPDKELRDTEKVPLPDGEDPVDENGIPASVREFFEKEVLPHVPDAWVDTARRDERDGKVGIIGYEINFNRYFYKYVPPRPLEEIEADIQEIEGEILEMLGKDT